MATRKTTKTNRKPKKLTETQISRRRQLYAIIFAALGVLFSAIAIVSGENVWRDLHYAMRGLFGWCAYLIGPIFFYLAVVFTLERPTFATGAQGWECLFLIMFLSGLSTVFSESMKLGEGFARQITGLYEYGMDLVGGGVLSAAFGLTSLNLLGRVGAIILLLVLIAADIMLITGTTLIGIANGTKKAGKKIKETVEEEVQHLNEIKASEPKPAPNPNAVIDIPLDDEPPKKASRIDIPVDAPAVTVAKPVENKVATSEPVNGFKVGGGAAAPVNTANVKSAEEQMADAKKDPQLEALIAGAVKAGDDKSEKAAAKALAADTEKKITEIMDDLESIPYTYPDISLLKEVKKPNQDSVTEEMRQNADTLVETLRAFGVEAKVIAISRGPAVTRYELQPGVGVKISKISGLADDIALSLAATGVRIEAPIPGKAAIGIEVPNRTVSPVSIREVIDSDEFRNAKSKLTVALGRDIAGKVVVTDLSKMPHLLIAGTTGSGKSVCINTMLMSLLYKSSPDEVKLLLVDPKVVELGVYNGVPHLLIPVVTDPRKAAGALNWAVGEMLKRYKMFAENGVRDISGFNELCKDRDDLQEMPRVVIVIDELADLMMVSSNEVEDAIARLAQMARAAGMHLVVATQRPSVDVITGLIKANISSRIAFAVSSATDSRTILDHGGAEKLLGKGDMLFSPIGCPKPSRIQGCFVSDKEIEDVIKFIKDSGTAKYDEDVLDSVEKLSTKEKGAPSQSGDAGDSDEDEMLNAAIECVVEMGQASTSMLQRRLKLGYARAARIIDQMEEKGIVGPFEGSKPRQVMVSKEQWLEMKMRQGDEASEPVPDEIM